MMWGHCRHVRLGDYLRCGSGCSAWHKVVRVSGLATNDAIRKESRGRTVVLAESCTGPDINARLFAYRCSPAYSMILHEDDPVKIFGMSEGELTVRMLAS